MVTEWRFDANNPYEDLFEESLLRLAGSRHLYDLVKWKLRDIQKDPKANYRGVVDGRMVYCAVTGPVPIPGVEIEALLLIYVLDERAKLIQRVFVRRAAELLDDPRSAVIATMAPTLRRAIEQALANARKPRGRH